MKGCERFEPRSHFKSRLSLIVQLNVVLNRTVVVDSIGFVVNAYGDIFFFKNVSDPVIELFRNVQDLKV